MDKYDIYFSGKVLENADIRQVKSKIGKLFKISGSRLDQLFSGQPVCVKTAVDAETAGQYRAAFRKANALVEIRPAGRETAVPVEPVESEVKKQEAVTQTTEEPTLTVLPANTGSLEDIAPQAPAAPEIDLSEYHLAFPGTEEPPAEAEKLEVDTSDMEVLPANTGTLEDCAEVKEPVPIPDISYMEASPPNTGSLEDVAENKPPVPIPDISHLQASPPNTGSLEDTAAPKQPVPIPDISNLHLVDED